MSQPRKPKTKAKKKKALEALLPDPKPQGPLSEVPDSSDPASYYDEDTGQLKEEIEYERTVAALDTVISQANAFSEMKRTRGWQLYSQFVQKTIQDLTKQLILERDFEKIRRIQSEIIAFDSLEALIDNSMMDAEKAKEDLKSLEE
jgi:hypothetical protein